MGRINERVARIQETYVAHATTTWLESLERSLAQMKEYQVGFNISCLEQGTNKDRPHARSLRIDG
jgi:hypothetical protein